MKYSVMINDAWQEHNNCPFSAILYCEDTNVSHIWHLFQDRNLIAGSTILEDAGYLN